MVTVRPASGADLDRLVDWARAMAQETEDKPLDADTVRAGIQRVLDEPAYGRYLVACIDGVPVGTLMLTFEWSDWRNGQWWWIQSVYVAPEHRRQGVYARLHRHVLGQAAATPGVCGLRLYVERDNTRAQATYAALGMDDAGYRIYEQPLRR